MWRRTIVQLKPKSIRLFTEPPSADYCPETRCLNRHNSNAERLLLAGRNTSPMFQCYSAFLRGEQHSSLTRRAQGIWRISISFRNYFKQLCKFVLSSSVVLGLIIGISLLLAGETTMEIDLTFEFGPFDGIWWIFGLPVLSVLIFVILSPLSFLIHQQLSRSKTEDAQGDAG